MKAWRSSQYLKKNQGKLQKQKEAKEREEAAIKAQLEQEVKEREEAAAREQEKKRKEEEKNQLKVTRRALRDLRGEKCPLVCPEQFQDMVLKLDKDQTASFAKTLENLLENEAVEQAVLAQMTECGIEPLLLDEPVYKVEVVPTVPSAAVEVVASKKAGKKDKKKAGKKPATNLEDQAVENSKTFAAAHAKSSEQMIDDFEERTAEQAKQHAAKKEAAKKKAEEKKKQDEARAKADAANFKKAEEKKRKADERESKKKLEDKQKQEAQRRKDKEEAAEKKALEEQAKKEELLCASFCRVRTEQLAQYEKEENLKESFDEAVREADLKKVLGNLDKAEPRDVELRLDLAAVVVTE